MRSMLFGALLALSASATAAAQTPLPVVQIDSSRDKIPDEPKVDARMRIAGAKGYRGRIGIEVRGHGSAAWPKRSFAVETRDRRGRDREVRLLGLPRESDWVLYASHGDRSLLRAELAFAVTRRMGRYAPRTRYVELVLNRRHHGVYVLMEPLEIGKRRIANEDAVLTELTRADRVKPSDAWLESRTDGAVVTIADPNPDKLSRRREAAVRRRVEAFEAALHSPAAADPARGWRRWLDEGSVVDFLLLQELLRNQDAFWASTHLQVPPQGRLVLGPPWDFDLSLGNVTVPWPQSPQGWIPVGRPWLDQLRDPALSRAMLARWRELRASGLQADLHATIRTLARRLDAPARRNFARWPVLARPLFTGQPMRDSYAEEVAATSRWLDDRIAWLDSALAQVPG